MPNPHFRCFNSFFFCNVHVSLPYDAILHPNALISAFFQLKKTHSQTAKGSTDEIFLHVESFLCQCNATSYFTFASAVLGHHTSKVAELCDWLQFFTIDHNYSHLSALPPRNSHNFGFFRIDPHVVFCLLGSIHYALNSTLGMRDYIAWSSARRMDCTSTPPTLALSYDVLDVDVRSYAVLEIEDKKNHFFTR